MALDATSGGMYSNSYVASTSEADTIAAVLAAIPGLGLSSAGWDAASSDAKELVLVQGADEIDLAPHRGRRQTSSQGRAYPRVATGLPRLDFGIPVAVKHAQVAAAMVRLTAPTETTEAAREGVASYSIGSKSVSFRDGASSVSDRPVSPAAERILRDGNLLLGRAASIYTPRA